MDKLTYNQIYYRENREREKVRSRKWVDENQEKVKKRRKRWYSLYGKKYREKNIERMRKAARKYARKHPQKKDPKKDKVIQARYRVKHKAEISKRGVEYNRKRIKTDINFRLRFVLRIRIIHAIQNQSTSKAYKSIELLGCPIVVVREYLEKQFTNGMTWENHGKVWEIDHKIPVSVFDLTKPEEQKKAFHYKNLQPLIKLENRKKSNKIMI